MRSVDAPSAAAPTPRRRSGIAASGARFIIPPGCGDARKAARSLAAPRRQSGRHPTGRSLDLVGLATSMPWPPTRIQVIGDDPGQPASDSPARAFASAPGYRCSGASLAMRCLAQEELDQPSVADAPMHFADDFMDRPWSTPGVSATLANGIWKGTRQTPPQAGAVPYCGCTCRQLAEGTTARRQVTGSGPAVLRKCRTPLRMITTTIASGRRRPP